MLQNDADFFFSPPMIYFGSLDQMGDEEEMDEEEGVVFPFILEISQPSSLQQDTGMYLRWGEM